MQLRALLALVIGVTLAGTLGGWLGAQLQTPDYTATAYVVVYRMPAGMTQLISPDEAYNLQSVYEAGVFQDEVIAKVLPFFHGLTAGDLRRSLQIAIVAYSPYTRVIVTRSDPRQAVALANSVSDTWAQLTQQLYEDTFTSLDQSLLARKQSVDAQVAALQSSLATQQTAQPPNPQLTQALQAELAAAQQQQSDLEEALASLTGFHDQGQSLAYTAVRANIRDVETRPDTFKVTLLATAFGFTSALLLAATIVGAGRSRAGRRERARAAALSDAGQAAALSLSPAEGWR